MGITYPGSHCDEMEATPHHWDEIDKVDGGSLFQCWFCHGYLWLPLHVAGAHDLGELMRRYGQNEGYCRYLNKHGAAKVMVAKMQDLGRLESEGKDVREFAKEVDRILRDKKYDREEV